MKTQNIYDRATNTYSSTIKFVPECVMTQEMYDETMNKCFLYLILFIIDIKLKKRAAELFLKTLFY